MPIAVQIETTEAGLLKTGDLAAAESVIPTDHRDDHSDVIVASGRGLSKTTAMEEAIFSINAEAEGLL